MSNDEKLQDAHEVREKAHNWVNTMVAAGISEQAAVIGAMQALVERALLQGGSKKTANWLRNQAMQIDVHGDELLRMFKN
ncbi:hypothetical protein [Croceicoccus sp. Ery15]|uniref:hypothetical protein n=1 Tax=Croceicoccus sp. Ery15 TaxID=1703338 RepID=UPI001E282FD1|nr:hypothetical protein [Croceicoccus sp. Ery15]